MWFTGAFKISLNEKIYDGGKYQGHLVVQNGFCLGGAARDQKMALHCGYP
jgi:hypothetical protein